jgi:acyl-CoA synthetase (AMP-forming)/AMP-acid ligase II
MLFPHVPTDPREEVMFSSTASIPQQQPTRRVRTMGVPTIWQRLLDSPVLPPADLASIRMRMSGRAPLPLRIAETQEARGLEFKQRFGMTDFGVNCFAISAEDAKLRRGSIGKPMMHTEARIAGPDGGELPPNNVGELGFCGPHECPGYWNRPGERLARCKLPRAVVHLAYLPRTAYGKVVKSELRESYLRDGGGAG